MNHRDTMNTEKTKILLVEIRSLIGDFQEQLLTLAFCVRQLCEILVCGEDFTAAPTASRPSKNCRQRFALRPGGTPQEISRGQARVSGRGPRLPCRTGHAPAGHRRSFWRHPPCTLTATVRRLGQVGAAAVTPHPEPFLRCPARARSHLVRFPGAASAGADLPPANLLRRPSGTGPDRRALTKGNHRCGNGVPNSVGCCCAALCSSGLCGHLGGFNCLELRTGAKNPADKN